MWRKGRELLLDLACQFPSWAFLAAGLTIIALTLLIPAYLQNRELVWQRDLLKLQAQRFTEQEQAYRQMNAAIDSGDPTLLTRLAYHYLRLKPSGTNILAFRPASTDGRLYAAPVAIAERYTTAETWLQRPLPKVGVDYPNYSPVESLLVRVVTSPVRGVFLLAGLLSLGLSLIPLDRQRQRARPQSARLPAGLILNRSPSLGAIAVTPAAGLESPAVAVSPTRLEPGDDANGTTTATQSDSSEIARAVADEPIALAPVSAAVITNASPSVMRALDDSGSEDSFNSPRTVPADPAAALSIRPPDDAL